MRGVTYNSLECCQLEREGCCRILWRYGLKRVCGGSPCQQASVYCIWTGTRQDEAGRTGALADKPAQCMFAEQTSNLGPFWD